MKIYLKKTDKGLVPASQNDQELFEKLSSKKTLRANIVVPRNYEFHKKFFAMIAVVWENLPEQLNKGYGTRDNFRYELTMRAGFREQWTTHKGAPMWRPKSISFAKMSEQDFSELYDKVLDDVIQNFIPGLEKSILEEEIICFL